MCLYLAYTALAQYVLMPQRMGVQTFRRENDRFWILAAHPEQVAAVYTAYSLHGNVM
jgi:hypothetical protein